VCVFVYVCVCVCVCVCVYVCVCVCVCVCVYVCVLPPLFPSDGSLLFQKRNRRDILITTLLTRITAHKQWKLKHKLHIKSLGNNANE